MKKFDLAAAQSGQPVQTDAGSPVHFVGLLTDGRAMIQWPNGKLGHTSMSELRMATAKITLHVATTFYKGKVYSCTASDEPFAQLKGNTNHDWCTRFSTIEVDAP